MKKNLTNKFLSFFTRRLRWVIPFWYGFTIFVTRQRKGSVTVYKELKEIPIALDYGRDWRSDPLKGALDVCMHPTKFQKRMDKATFGQHDKLGDCFPAGTRLLRRDGSYVAIESININDIIHDGTSWVTVHNKWDRGPKTIVKISMNNGSDLNLSDSHKMVVMAAAGKIWKEKQVKDLKLGQNLLQSREFESGTKTLNKNIAFLIGAYLSEGWLDGNRIGISGIKNSKLLREKAIESAKNLCWRISECDRYIRIYPSKENMHYFKDLGRTATQKKLPHVNWDTSTVNEIVSGLEMGDAGYSTNGTTLVYSTTSDVLAEQYRTLKRMQGYSTHLTCVIEHGGLGSNPINRITVRANHKKRPWAKIKKLEVLEQQEHCYDIATSSGKVYLPDGDIIVRNCDDHAMYWCVALLKSGLAQKVWFSSFQYWDDKTIGGHAVCSFEDSDGQLWWCDYHMPEKMSDKWGFAIQGTSKKSAELINATQFEITLGRNDTPKWGKSDGMVFI